jgi:hypothetical protein
MKNILFCCFALLACMVNGQISQQQINKWNADFYNTYDQDLEKAFLLAKKALKESKKIDKISYNNQVVINSNYIIAKINNRL